MLPSFKTLARRGFELARRSLENPSTPFASWFRPNSLAGVAMDEDTALEHLPIFAAVNRIATDVGLAQPQLMERQADGAWKAAVGNPLEYLLTVTPNGEIDSTRWRQASMAHVLTWGNAYSQIEYDDDWQPCAFHLLSPRRMRVYRTPSLQIRYDYHTEHQGMVTLQPWEVLHFAGLGFDGLVGYSPIAMARETLGLGKAADLFGASFFGNAARPSGILKSPSKLSDPAKANLRESFAALQAGSTNTGRVIIAEEGLDWASLTIPPNEAQFLETREMSIKDVARLYNVPVHKLQSMDGATFSNIEEQNLDYLQSTLIGHCTMFGNQIRLKCLSHPAMRGRYKIDHDFGALLKANAPARAQYYATAITNGWMTRNRVAIEEGYPALPGGDNPLLPLNMIQIGPDGKPLPNDEVTQMVRSFLQDKAPPAIPQAPAPVQNRRRRRR